MNSERFDELKASIIEAGLIMQGKKRPSREFIYEISDPPKPTQHWAVCIESDDLQLLIPRKPYLVKFADSGVWVRDESGEMTVCDKENFLPISFAPEVEELLALAA